MGWVANGTPSCFNPGKETLYQMYRRLGGPTTDRNNIAFFGVRILQILPLNKSYPLRYPGRHCHRTTSNHILLTNLKNFCTLWCWFNLDVLFMDSCFSAIKWETLTYLERCEGNFSSENETLINHKVLVQSIRIVVVEKSVQFI